MRGEHIEILAEARPGRDPFVVRVGHTTLALRRREAQNIWVSCSTPDPPTQRASPHVAERHERPRGGGLAAPQLSLSLIGVPNCGKTALFNRLTGSRQKVANYPGVTVERKEGRLHRSAQRPQLPRARPARRLQPRADDAR